MRRLTSVFEIVALVVVHVVLAGLALHRDSLTEQEFRQQTAGWCLWDNTSLAPDVAAPQVEAPELSPPVYVDDDDRISLVVGSDWVRMGFVGQRQPLAEIWSDEWQRALEEEIKENEFGMSMPPVFWSLTVDAEADAGVVVELMQRLAFAGLPEGELWLAYQDPARPQPPNELVDDVADQIQATGIRPLALLDYLKPLAEECPMTIPAFYQAALGAPADSCTTLLDGFAENIAPCRFEPGSIDRLLAGLYLLVVDVGPRRARVPIRIDWLAPPVAQPTGTWAELVAAQFRVGQPWVGRFEFTPALLEAVRVKGCEEPEKEDLHVDDRSSPQACRVACVAGDQDACANVRGYDRAGYAKLACDRAISGWECLLLSRDVEGEPRAAMIDRITAISGPACDEEEIASECEALYWSLGLAFMDDVDIDRANYYAQRTCDLGGTCLADRRPSKRRRKR